MPTPLQLSAAAATAAMCRRSTSIVVRRRLLWCAASSSRATRLHLDNFNRSFSSVSLSKSMQRPAVTPSHSNHRQAYHYRSYTTTLDFEQEEAKEKSRRTTIRLYRILLRQCRDFRNAHVVVDPPDRNEGDNDKDDGASTNSSSIPDPSDKNDLDAPILLQPMLEASDWGRQSLYDKDIGNGDGHIFRFFRDWNIELDFINSEDNEHEEDDNDENEDSEYYHDGVPASDAYRKLRNIHVPIQMSIDDWYRAVTGRGPSAALRFPTWTTPREIQGAIREAFRVEYATRSDENDADDYSSSSSSSSSDSDDHDGTTSSDEEDSDGNGNEGGSSRDLKTLPASVLHHWAIRANQLLREQSDMWRNVSVTTTGNIRVTATSRCIGHTSPSSTLPMTVVPNHMATKYRFSYRIRIENLSNTEHVQLLGRYWNIQELDLDPEKGDEPGWRSPIIVNAPKTGAVGHLPVLEPGKCFEYMSGTDLATARGKMRGLFYMAKVPPGTTSARTGDIVKALESPDKLQVSVSPFPLIAPAPETSS